MLARVPSQRRQALSNTIIRCTKSLYSEFKDHLPLTNPQARAAGLYFMNKYYQLTDIKPREYGLYAIAALHLATKVCESRVLLQEFVRVVADARKHKWGNYEEIFDELDGIPEFHEGIHTTLTKLFVNREMKILTALNWDLSVPNTFACANAYIRKVVQWHLPKSDPRSFALSEELSGLCEKFLGDLQYTSVFYCYGPEMIALAAVKLSFDRLQLPLVSPKHAQWWTFLAPVENDSEDLQYVFGEARKFFEDVWQQGRIAVTEERKTRVLDEEMMHWHRFPVMQLKEIPICHPPPFKMLDEIVKDNDSFKHMDADHLPEREPPDVHRSPLFQEWRQEMNFLRAEQKPKKKGKENPKKLKEKKKGQIGRRDSPPQHRPEHHLNPRRSSPPPPRRRDDWDDYHGEKGRRRDSDVGRGRFRDRDDEQGELKRSRADTERGRRVSDSPSRRREGDVGRGGARDRDHEQSESRRGRAETERGRPRRDSPSWRRDSDDEQSESRRGRADTERGRPKMDSPAWRRNSDDEQSESRRGPTDTERGRPRRDSPSWRRDGDADRGGPRNRDDEQTESRRGRAETERGRPRRDSPPKGHDYRERKEFRRSGEKRQERDSKGNQRKENKNRERGKEADETPKQRTE